MAVLCDLMEQRYRTIATVVGSRAIQRILIEDASGQVMPKSNTDAFPAHDNHYGKTVLRDMGYFSLNEFNEIEQREAWWLTRLPLTTVILLADGYTLEKYLKSHCKDIIDLDVIVGEQSKNCRLVAMRAAPEITAPGVPWQSSSVHGNKRSTSAKLSIAKATNITYKHFCWRE